MKIGFIGNYQPGYVGEIADETHITREIESFGHQVFRIPRDEWREYVIEKFPVGKYPHIPENVTFDILIICKWHHFYDGSFIIKAREKYKCPVFLWVWDYMYDQGFPQWHLDAIKAADLYLGNDVHCGLYLSEFKNKAYYFPFDVCDGELPIYKPIQKEYDVIFTGSCIGQGNRIEYLKIINQTVPVTVFSWNHEAWQKMGFMAYPAVYGKEYNELIAKSKIVLGFSVNPNCWGYWSNRTGKVLQAGGCLLYEYAPGMELSFGDAMDYFNSPEEAIEKIQFYLSHEDERLFKERKAFLLSTQFTSKTRVKQLMILIDRYLKTNGKGWHY